MPAQIKKIAQDGEKHKSDVTCLAFVNGYLFSGGQDGCVKVWDDNLNLKRNINLFDADKYVFSLCVDVNGRLYAAGSNGIVKVVPSPLSSDESKDIYKCAENPVQILFCHGESVWAGDGLGILLHFENYKKIQQYEMVEEIKSLAVEGKLIYTIRDNDLCISEIHPEKGLYLVKAVIPGKSPMKLIGPYVNGQRSLIVTVTRDGRGLSILNNCPHRDFVKVWLKDNVHDMIINAISGNEKTLFSGGFDGIVKMWSDISDIGKLSGELNVGSCINSLCHGPNEQTVFVGTSDGYIRKVEFE
ncbi:uncharacterized protein LOC129614120 [Condylostylus longicornis]|uniref:uncharacterized protein LOC129614120 n=1 Tax=Condylostylus longicornis TaxID=2530218 RepID=UPI00244DE54C|nr:uncharacterized protein LOC129614120 [Condylostylus longicornis]